MNLNVDGREPVEGFAREFRLTLPILLDPGKEVGRAYRVSAIPAIFLFDRQGRVTSRRLGDPAWDSPRPGRSWSASWRPPRSAPGTPYGRLRHRHLR